MQDCFVEVCVAMTELNPDDKLVCDKIAALVQVNSIIQAYSSEGYDADRLLKPIAEKKIAFIKAAKSKKALEEILKQPKVHYDGNHIVPLGEHYVPEEELIIWSLTSLRAPLISAGTDRIMELMKQVYPEFKL